MYIVGGSLTPLTEQMLSDDEMSEIEDAETSLSEMPKVSSLKIQACQDR